MKSINIPLLVMAGIAQRISVLLMATLALALTGVTIASALGFAPWLELPARFGAVNIENMGMYAQIFFTAVCVSLLFFLPSHGRVMQLENSHRKFHLTMEDVARAYRMAHEADRAKLFKTGAEFDEVRERIAHLRNHPDLAGLEPDILEAAAQMSFVSRDLAQTYSDDKVERARVFLRQRHEEMEDFRANLSLAQQTTDELKHWLTQVEADELVVTKQVDALKSDLKALLPKLGVDLHETVSRDRNVVPMSTNPRRERGRGPRNGPNDNTARNEQDCDGDLEL
ncbi:DNA repair protein [Aliiroseovarius sp. KMU-50]|uniref:DNA repair protein n=1 Tax=Aliiroseovarius salicola TaxID=3009082 RepID=A0ABT4W318_9RHOB|nr:DNA repair protein [Aliiroseovarius sp. KMU-50]MDA5094375.1 DNA repair protein [Aliiroseovarius sp. KMU-50]